MQDLSALLSDILSYMNAGWRNDSRSIRWLVRVGVVALLIGLVWLLGRM
jgi:hypothetical protein